MSLARLAELRADPKAAHVTRQLLTEAQPPRKPRRGAVLAPVRPNVGIEVAYRRRMWTLIGAMQADVLEAVRAAYAGEAPNIVMDGSPAKELQAMMSRLGRKWQGRFDRAAPELARYFATAAANRSSATLMAILKRAGFVVPFKLTAEINTIVQAAVAENVTLIKSIPAQYLAQVEGHVMRSVQLGGDLGTLTTHIVEQYGVTKRRAALIARDQNAKATAVIQKARYAELDIKEAVWMHSGGGKHPRPSHVRAGRDKTRFKVDEGWFDPDAGERIWPGTLISCRCVARPVLPFLAA